MANVTFTTLLEQGHLEPDETQRFFIDDVNQVAVRVVTAVPINGLIDDVVFDDEFLEVSSVYYIFKGKAHEQDGTGGTGTLQFKHNKSVEKPCDFSVFMAEITP
jgi:hypothetical protein